MNKIISELDLYIFCPHCTHKLALITIDNERVKKCSKCGFVFWHKPKPSVSILVHKGGKVLMLQRAKDPFKNYWCLPGGYVRYEETAEQAIKREAKEEIGLDVIIEGIVGIYKIDDDPRGNCIDTIFSGRALGEINISGEDKKWRYFSPQNLPENIAWKHRQAIKDWYAHSVTI